MTDKEYLIEMAKEFSAARAAFEVVKSTPTHGLTWEQLVDFDICYVRTKNTMEARQLIYDRAMAEYIKDMPE